jgi:hypothetical protein
LESPEGAAAVGAIDRYVLDGCGFETVHVEGVDYEFQGVPKHVPSGTVAFDFENGANDEEHEMVLLRLDEGVHTKVKKLLAMPEIWTSASSSSVPRRPRPASRR